MFNHLVSRLTTANSLVEISQIDKDYAAFRKTLSPEEAADTDEVYKTLRHTALVDIDKKIIALEKTMIAR
jgi:hypothetical protein